MHSTLILIQCHDKIGLVARIASTIVSFNLNIDAMHQFVDEGEFQFFARFECSGAETDGQLIHDELLKHLPDYAIVKVNPASSKKLAVLVTKEYHCLGDILARNFFHNTDAHVSCVIGNHTDLESFTERFSVPFYYITHNDRSKEEFENEILGILSEHQPDYLVLAKFMQILSADFVAHYPNRIINIHHSFLPAFAGGRPYHQAFIRGVKLMGATAHFVTESLDDGPIITQQTIAIDHTYSAAEMVKAGQEVEKTVLNKAIALVTSDKIFVSGNKTIVFE